jgi:DNA excision repair protein ERCC-5
LNFANDELIKSLVECLKFLSIPWLQAPYEAEAQCAFLEMAGISDGTISEDSDLFLFGA